MFPCSNIFVTVSCEEELVELGSGEDDPGNGGPEVVGWDMRASKPW